MEKLLRLIAERGYRDEDGKLLTDDRDFHEALQRAKDTDEAVKIATAKTYGTFS